MKLRDFVLVKLCQTLSSFSTDKLFLGFSEDMAAEAQEKLKINKVVYHAGNNKHPHPNTTAKQTKPESC